jgi:aldose 1-epimerase
LPWTAISRKESALFPSSDTSFPSTSTSTIHRLISPAGSDGFPCTLEIEGLVSVSPSEGSSTGKVTVVLRARIVDDGSAEVQKGTPVNLTVHWGFNLSEFDTEDVLGHKMFINVRPSSVAFGHKLTPRARQSGRQDAGS